MSRLVVVDGTELRVVDLARAGRITTLPPHPQGPLANRQPVWSPDGTLVAWSAFDRRRADSPAFVSIADLTTGTRVDHPVVFPAFYLHWRPDGRAIAALGEGPLGLELTVIEADTGASSIRSRGTPLFFDWAPDGTLCANVGRGRDQRLELLRDDAQPDPFQSLTPASFTAPAWRGDDEVIVAVQSEGTRLLVTVDRRAAITRALSTVSGLARFTVATGGHAVAWVSGRPAGEPPTPGATPPGVRAEVTNHLVAYDVARDKCVAIIDAAPITFSWSPDGTKLLYCVARERGEPPLLQWHVWCNGTSRAYASFRPSTVLARDYLPYAEQFSRSVSWWAPDGGSFCFAGTDTAGRAGVFVQPLDGRTQRIGPGQVAVWSPR